MVVPEGSGRQRAVEDLAAPKSRMGEASKLLCGAAPSAWSAALRIAAPDPEQRHQIGAGVGVQRLDLLQNDLSHHGVRAVQALVRGVHGYRLVGAVLLHGLALEIDRTDGRLVGLAQEGYRPVDDARHQRAQLVLALAFLFRSKRTVVGEQFLRVDGPLAVAAPKLAEECRAAGDVLYGDIGLAAAGCSERYPCSPAPPELYRLPPQWQQAGMRYCERPPKAICAAFRPDEAHCRHQTAYRMQDTHRCSTSFLDSWVQSKTA